MPITDIQLAQLTTPCVPSIVPPALQTRVDRISGVRPGAIPQPVLRFTDLINGPAAGLGDGLGSGVIVTIWGQGFGESQGEVFFTDSLGVERPAAHIYYWKRADGQLPGGPSPLWRSHLMYEVAFSIPAGSADGLGSIRIRKAGWAATVYDGYSLNTLPFTVRAGRIIWVAPEGDNNAAGTFVAPKKYINGGDNSTTAGVGNRMQAGDTVYTRGVIDRPLSDLGISDGYVQYAMFIRTPTDGSKDNPAMIVSYPGTRSQIIGYHRGFNCFGSKGVGIAKYAIEVGNIPTSDTTITNDPYYNCHIVCNYQGRYIGNATTDKAGFCSTGQASAIGAGGSQCDSIEVLGNWLHDIGCDGTSHYHHTTYFTVRNAALKSVNAWRFAFNFLENCKAKYGYHAYDQAQGSTPTNDDSGNVVGTLDVSNNVFYRQKGAAISLHTLEDAWTGAAIWTCNALIKNNVMIECGKGPVSSNEIVNGTSAYAMYLGGWWQPESLVIEGNLIYKYSDASSRLYAPAAAMSINFANQPSVFSVKGNVIFSDGNFDVIRFAGSNVGLPNATGYNAFYSFDSANTKTLPSGWSNNIQGQNLRLELNSVLVDTAQASPLKIGAALTYTDPFDFYGRARAGTIGPVEAI